MQGLHAITKHCPLFNDRIDERLRFTSERPGFWVSCTRMLHAANEMNSSACRSSSKATCRRRHFSRDPEQAYASGISAQYRGAARIPTDAGSWRHAQVRRSSCAQFPGQLLGGG
jgi:hypothetical protein